MDLSVITVAYNCKVTIAEQIRSVALGAKNISYEHWIVDNGSVDGTADFISEIFPQVKLLRNDRNEGFGHANNQAALRSSGDMFLFLNPDMRVEEGSLDRIAAWMRGRNDVGIASCKLTDINGKFNEHAKPRRFPNVFDQVMLLLKVPHLFPKVMKNYLYEGFNSDVEQEVDSVRGSFMLMRRELYAKLGWAFDPRYYIWFEDVDICRECKKNNYKVMYTPVISCVDYVGQTFKQLPLFWKQKKITKSMLQYFQKWEPWYKWIWIAAARPIALFMALVYSFFYRR